MHSRGSFEFDHLLNERVLWREIKKTRTHTNKQIDRYKNYIINSIYISKWVRAINKHHYTHPQPSKNGNMTKKL